MKFAPRVDSGHMGVAKLLLVSQADRNAVNPTTGDSLLHLATKRGYPKMVELLLDLGLPVDVRNPGYAKSINPENSLHFTSIEFNHRNDESRTALYIVTKSMNQSPIFAGTCTRRCMKLQ